MKNYILFTILIIISLIVFNSCITQSDLVTEEKKTVKAEQIPEIKEESKEPVSANTEEVTIPETLEGTELEKAETDIAELINKLNKLVSSKNYAAWREYLSDGYIEYYSNPDSLAEMSKSPILLKNKIVLRTLQDYFNYIVVGSRQNVKLDDIKVLDRNHIKAYMFINNNPVIIYELVRIDNNWKIDKF